MVVVLSDGPSKTMTVTRAVGQNITLHTGLSGLPNNSRIFWTRGSERHCILDFDEGELKFAELPRFHLDRDSGSLMIDSLNKTDAKLYRVHIISSGRDSTHDFNLTVVGRYC